MLELKDIQNVLPTPHDEERRNRYRARHRPQGSWSDYMYDGALPRYSISDFSSTIACWSIC